MKENYDKEIFHPYTSVVNINQADKDIFNDKTIDLESKKDRDIKFFENTANTTEAGDTISLDPITHSDCPNLFYAQRVEGDQSCTYFPAKIDANLQIFEDIHSINQSNHSKVFYAQPLEGDQFSRPFFPPNFSTNQKLVLTQKNSCPNLMTFLQILCHRQQQINTSQSNQSDRFLTNSSLFQIYGLMYQKKSKRTPASDAY